MSRHTAPVTRPSTERNFEAMTKQYADSITWTDHAQGRTFTTPQEFKDDFLAGWVQASSDIRITGPRYIDAGQTVVCTFTVSARRTDRSDRFPPPARNSRCRCARCGTSTPRAGRRWRPLLRPGLAAHAVGPDAVAAPAGGRFRKRKRSDDGSGSEEKPMSQCWIPPSTAARRMPSPRRRSGSPTWPRSTRRAGEGCHGGGRLRPVVAGLRQGGRLE